MRSLNTSLPTAYSSRPVPPEQLLQAFKSAALSVTNLYKSAAQDQNSSRAAGYQDALDDLLRFLDSENLGLQDGEGWRVRQWATERYEGTASQAPAESEDEKSEPETTQHKDPMSAHPQSEQQPKYADVTLQNAETHRQNDVRATSSEPDSKSTFKFRYPAQASSMVTENDLGTSTGPVASSPVSEPDHASSGPIHIINRGNKSQRASGLRHNTRAANRSLGSASGTKRKNPYPDLNFFDISNFGPRDGPDPGNKRGRFA